VVYGRPGGATRGKWEILNRKVESGLMSDSELQGGRCAHLGPQGMFR
jgi:hypothetical protein